MLRKTIFIMISYFLVGCVGSYNKNYNPKMQFAAVFMGLESGNHVIFFNLPKFPYLEIQRKLETDSSFVHLTTLKRNPISLRNRVGNNGPNFFYNWSDPNNRSSSTRYKLIVLDESLISLMVLDILYRLPNRQTGEWQRAEEDEDGNLKLVED